MADVADALNGIIDDLFGTEDGLQLLGGFEVNQVFIEVKKGSGQLRTYIIVQVGCNPVSFLLLKFNGGIQQHLLLLILQPLQFGIELVDFSLMKDYKEHNAQGKTDHGQRAEKQDIIETAGIGYLKQSHLKKIIFQKTLQLGEKKVLGIQMSFFEKIINFILDLIVRKKIKNQFGGKIKAFISGGGPLDYNVGLFLNSLGLPTLQGYGLTEASPVVSCNPINKIKIDTVGKIFKDVSVNIASDGEILVKGENLMLGYWNNQIETEKIIKNGWLYTGDIGEIDNEGYLKITDRKKDIIVNAGGDNIAPSKIENLLANYPEIIQSYIYGDKKNYLVALIVVSKELEDRKNKIRIIIDKVNQELSIIEKIKKFIIIDDPFTIENQMLTPTMKIRRHQIKKVFGEQLEKLYF